MEENSYQIVGNEALRKVLTELNNVVLQFDETTDPSDPEYQDECERLLTSLNQALEDAVQVRQTALAAAAAADAAARNAGAAAGSASSAAAEALLKAGVADTAARNAQDVMDSAKGKYNSLPERLDAIEAGGGDVSFGENNDPLSLLE